MNELIQAQFHVDGREGMRCYCIELRWSNGVCVRSVIFESELPAQARKIQAIIDATKEMCATERLRYIEKHY